MTSRHVKGNIYVLGGGGRYIFNFLLFYCWDRSRFLPTVADSSHTGRCDETRQFRQCRRREL